MPVTKLSDFIQNKKAKPIGSATAGNPVYLFD